MSDHSKKRVSCYKPEEDEVVFYPDSDIALMAISKRRSSSAEYYWCSRQNCHNDIS
ncbi:MAG: hypothetical protein U5L09_01380 [Bacteroidales bacterium]|nr:hypothetical protein [Bacteroidales bacterium]